MPHPCDDRLVAVKVRDLINLLMAAYLVDEKAIDEIVESYSDMLTRMNSGSNDWMDD